MKKENIEKIIEYFENKYKNPVPALKYSSTYELLVAVILSAQCTDVRVNKITDVLFKVSNTPQQMVDLGVEKLEKYIFSCGLYKSKAKHIISASQDIIEKFGGQVPSDFDNLKSLAGVGQKTANVVSSVAFNRDAIAVDTHVFRVSNRLGLVKADTPLKTEEQLKKALPKEKWSKCHHYLIFHGREICKARNPLCDKCELSSYCSYFKKSGAISSLSNKKE